MMRPYVFAAALGVALCAPASATTTTTETSILPVHYSEYKHEHDAGYAGPLDNCSHKGYVCEGMHKYDGAWHKEPKPEASMKDDVADEAKQPGPGESIGRIVDMFNK